MRFWLDFEEVELPEITCSGSVLDVLGMAASHKNKS
jgi:hypothetical protein